MRRLASFLVSIAAVAAMAIAQGPYQPGARLVSWRNPIGVGSQQLDAMVCYPATATGYATPVLPRAGGYPVVVFLHGYDRIGLDYIDLGMAWARAGFMVVLPNTARTDLTLLAEDAQAMPDAILAANGDPGSPLVGMFAVQRFGLAGHSMGGAACAIAQASNPVYHACLALAPVNPALTGPYAGQVTVPFGIVVGQGDFLTSLPAHAQPFFDTLGTADGLKFLYVMDQDCTHTNLAGLDSVPTAEVFQRVLDLGVGFFSHFLGTDPLALDRCVGMVAQAEPRLVSLAQRVQEPQIWVSDALRVGHRARISVACEPGYGGVMVGLQQIPGLLTPFGRLRLDPQSVVVYAVGPVGTDRRFDAMFEVPSDPNLIGFSVSFQALGDVAAHMFALGAAMTLVVES